MNGLRLIGSAVAASVLATAALPLQAVEWAGSKIWGTCHREIYRKYSATPMALTSGTAASAGIPEQSFSANSGYRYSLVHRDRRLVLEFGKEDRKSVV